MQHLEQNATTYPYQLRHGESVTIAPLTPADKPLYLQAFNQLSPNSRYRRFLAPMPHLPPAMLQYFLHVDQNQHVAWGIKNADGDKGLGVARFARLLAEPQVAEFALTVLDDYQQRGVGSLLLAILYMQAQRVGVTTLRAVYGYENQFMSSWLGGLGATIGREAGLFVADLPVVVMGKMPANSNFYTLVTDLTHLTHMS